MSHEDGLSIDLPRERQFGNRLWYLWPLTAVLAVVVIAYTLTGSGVDRSSPTEKLFLRWRQTDQGSRHHIASILVERNALVDMDIDAVMDQLGKPGYTHDKGCTHGWYIGDSAIADRISLDMNYLEIRVQERKVKSAAIVKSKW